MPEINTYKIIELSKNHFQEIKKLKQKKNRRNDQKTLVEGLNLLEQMLDNGIFPLEIITGKPELSGSVFKGTKCPVYLAKHHEIMQLAETETPQSVVAVFNIPDFKLLQYKFILYLDGIQDPGNLGTIFRTAAAFKIEGVVLSPDCCEVFSPKVIRASLGSVFWIPSITEDDEWLANQKAEVIGLTVSGATTLNNLKLNRDKPLIVVIGSEGNGISKEISALLTDTASIPISTKMESLNAAVAAGIALYEITGRFSY